LAVHDPEHDESERPVTPVDLLVLTERRRTVCDRGDETVPPAPVSSIEEPADDIPAPHPPRERRHRVDGVLSQQRDQAGYVVTLEGGHVLFQQLALPVVRWIECLGRGFRETVVDGHAGTLESTVDRRRTRVQELRDLLSAPIEHVTENENRALPGREPLEGSDECQANRLAHLD